ncbi:MAG: DUF1698 domain-containing protein [Rhodospirillaceae bacterium]
MGGTSTDVRARVASVPYWYHKIDLGGGVVTPGWAPIKAEAYGVPKSLIGHRVLDIGAWDGYWTFEALRRGATEVIAIDDFSDDLGAEKVARPKWETFDIARDALGWTDAEASRREMSVYDVNPSLLGTFDTVFFFGTLYHLRHPLLALDKIASVCTGTLYVETAICDGYSPYVGTEDGHADRMVMEFYPTVELGNNATNWWAPTLHCLGHMVKAAGFDDVQVWKLTDKPDGATTSRGFARGTKRR